MFLLSLAAPTLNPSSNDVAVKNEYAKPGVKQVVVQALKNGSPLVQQTMMTSSTISNPLRCLPTWLGASICNEEIRSKAVRTRRHLQKIDLTNPIIQSPAKTVNVTVTNKGKAIEIKGVSREQNS